MSVERAVAVVKRNDGVARARTLRRAGVSKRTMAAAVRSGLLIRPRQGVYALPTLNAAVRQALSHCGAAGCVTAARELGLWTLDDGPDAIPHTWVHPARHPVRVAIPPADGPPDGCCVFHRDLPLDEASLHRVGILHCLVQILGCRGHEAFFAALESALRQRLIDDDARRLLRDAIPAADRWLVDLAGSDADSGLESLLRLRLHRLGITVASQVPIPGVGTVDFVIGDCLILEADGATHDGEARHSDRIRDAVALALGCFTLRFDYAMIVHDWEVVETAILAALDRGLHRSAAGLNWPNDRPIG